MTTPDRSAQLETELHDLREAALSIIVGMADAIAKSPEGKRELADGFEDAATKATGAASDLSREIADILRRIAGPPDPA